MIDQLQRAAIALTLALALVAMGHTIDGWEFWCVLAMLLCSNHLQFRQGVEQGVVSTMDTVADLTDAQRAELLDLVRKVREED
jgi:hypothetical protein